MSVIFPPSDGSADSARPGPPKVRLATDPEKNRGLFLVGGDLIEVYFRFYNYIIAYI